MAVDISHLDEVRMVVPRNDGSSDILNDFTEFGKGECMDVLRPIVASMTVSRNYLRSEERVTVFVENYRDYFILSGFSASSDLDVIPVNGITDTASAKDLAKVLRSIERNPILLADEDLHGKEFLDELKSEGVKVYTVSEIFEGKKESLIDLFSEDDLSVLPIEGASFDTMVSVSRSMSSDKGVSKKTKENFCKMLDYISLE